MTMMRMLLGVTAAALLVVVCLAVESIPERRVCYATCDSSGKAEDYPYTIQVASGRRLDNVRQDVTYLQLKGLDAHYEGILIREQELWYRILIGCFMSKDSIGKSKFQVIYTIYKIEIIDIIDEHRYNIENSWK